jgi:acetolactate synthase-1/3 small subunit
MTNSAALSGRPGQVGVPKEGVRSHILVLFVNDQHGTLDRIVGVLRRRRAGVQKFAVGQSEEPDVVRITVVTDDSEVGVEQLVEQLRKIVDVRQIVNLSSGQAIAREMALIKVNSSPVRQREIIEVGHLSGAYPVDVNAETVTLEVTGSADKVEKLVSQLQPFGIREIARTGCVAMSRENPVKPDV